MHFPPEASFRAQSVQNEGHPHGSHSYDIPRLWHFKQSLDDDEDDDSTPPPAVVADDDSSPATSVVLDDGSDVAN